jgi:hypothetical protein
MEVGRSRLSRNISKLSSPFPPSDLSVPSGYHILPGG